MQSLKQLSFLAAGNGLSTTQYHPEPQPQPQVNYQQPYMQQQYQPPAQNVCIAISILSTCNIYFFFFSSRIGIEEI
jgi:hypothetical protein